MLGLKKGMTRASYYVVGKSPFIQILLKIASRKAKDNGLWIPSRPTQILQQDLRAGINSEEEKGALYDSVNDKEKVIWFCSAVNLILVNTVERDEIHY